MLHLVRLILHGCHGVEGILERGSPGQELGQIWVVSIPRGRETTIRLMRSINLLFESRLALPALLLLLRLEARHSILQYSIAQGPIAFFCVEPSSLALTSLFGSQGASCHRHHRLLPPQPK